MIDGAIAGRADAKESEDPTDIVADAVFHGVEEDYTDFADEDLGLMVREMDSNPWLHSSLRTSKTESIESSNVSSFPVLSITVPVAMRILDPRLKVALNW